MSATDRACQAISLDTLSIGEHNPRDFASPKGNFPQLGIAAHP